MKDLIQNAITELLRLKKIYKYKSIRTKDIKKYKEYSLMVRCCELSLHEFDKVKV